MEELVALKFRKSASNERAMIVPRVVLPVPGGPQSTSERISPRSIILRKGFPGPTKCSWPTYSSSVRGRRRSAKGGRCLVFFEKSWLISHFKSALKITQLRFFQHRFNSY